MGASRPPNILDMVQAVTEVAPAYPAVKAWWYVPSGRFASDADLPSRTGWPVELAVELDGLGAPDLLAIAAELSARLWQTPVTLRLRGGADAGQALYRLVTRKE